MNSTLTDDIDEAVATLQQFSQQQPNTQGQK